METNKEISGRNLEKDRNGFERLGTFYPPQSNVTIEPVSVANVQCYWLVPEDIEDKEVVVYLHGGGFIYGSMKSHGALVSHIAYSMRRRILFLEYSLAPEDPFPKALDETLAVLEALQKADTHFQFGLLGDSAGGNLVFSVALTLKALRRKPSLYHIAISPWVNLEATYPSYQANQKLDPVLTKEFVEYSASLYIGSHSAKDPLVSPVYGDFAGLTPSLIMYGSREILGDDSVHLYHALQKAGVKSELFLSEGSVHVWPLADIQSGSAQVALTRIRSFANSIQADSHLQSCD